MGKIELRKCPFCGGEAEFVIKPVKANGGWCDAVYVRCVKCNARSSRRLYSAKIYKNDSEYSETAEAWNTRKPMERIDEKLCDMIEPNIDMDTGAHCNNWVIDLQNEIVGKCIGIVREAMRGAENDK